MENDNYQPNFFDEERPRTHFVGAILATVFCFVPFGIVAICYASRVDPLWNEGRHDDAWDCSQKARNWAVASLVTSIIGSIIILRSGFFDSLFL